jgi:hypothetical protein
MIASDPAAARLRSHYPLVEPYFVVQSTTLGRQIQARMVFSAA